MDVLLYRRDGALAIHKLKEGEAPETLTLPALPVELDTLRLPGKAPQSIATSYFREHEVRLHGQTQARPLLVYVEQ